jgi:integrase
MAGSHIERNGGVRDLRTHDEVNVSVPCYSQDVSTYDCRPEITESEMNAIERFLTLDGKAPDMFWIAGANSKWSPDDMPELERLVRPILDVIDATDKNKFQISVLRQRRRAVRALLRETYYRRRSLWAWTEKEWIETLDNRNEAFFKRHRVGHECRMNVMAVAYFLGNFSDFRKTGTYEIYKMACRLFGSDVIDAEIERVRDKLQGWGYTNKENFKLARTTICEALIAVRSPRLEDITLKVLDTLRKRLSRGKYIQTYALAISKALVGLGLLSESLPDDLYFNTPRPDIALVNVSPEWASWCKRWLDTSTLQPRARKVVYYGILIAGRWLYKVHPEISSPAQWTRELAADYVAAVDRTLIGQWVSGISYNRRNMGKPLTPVTKSKYLSGIRTFFNDCHEWEWMPRRIDPSRALRTPDSITKLIGRDPRVIDYDIWAKLLWAGLNLSVEDLPEPDATVKVSGRAYYYPLEMMRALVIVWLFAGLRRDEIRRLRVGCVRWQREDLMIPGTNEVLPKDSVCMLLVPANKTSPTFVKPVDRVVGEAIEAWEQVRTDTPLMLDKKTGENVYFLFAHRTKPTGLQFINTVVIPMLCRKAGVPEQDARGDITSHRARSTIATQLSNTMTLLELMEWLGHSNPSSTMSYVQTSMIKVAKAYKNADYSGRNTRIAGISADVGGSDYEPAAMEDWADKSERLVFEQLQENKETLSRIRQSTQFSDEQRAAMEESIGALDRLLAVCCTKPSGIDSIL